jgi:hypothetical protein
MLGCLLVVAATFQTRLVVQKMRCQHWHVHSAALWVLLAADVMLFAPSAWRIAS